MNILIIIYKAQDPSFWKLKYQFKRSTAGSILFDILDLKINNTTDLDGEEKVLQRTKNGTYKHLTLLSLECKPLQMSLQ